MSYKYTSGDRVISLVLGNILITSLVLFPIVSALFFGETFSPGLWLGYIWGMAAGILLGFHRLQGSPQLLHLEGCACLPWGCTGMGIATGVIITCRLMTGVIRSLSDQNLIMFVGSGGCTTLVIFAWCDVIVRWRERSG